MKSIKQGRSSSLMGGIFGIVFAIVCFIMSGFGKDFFGAFSWVALLMGILGIALSVYSFYCAFAKNRPSEIDIVDSKEEPDPLNQALGAKSFCPACGEQTNADDAFCRHCGKELK